jgi:hypothetical protein
VPIGATAVSHLPSADAVSPLPAGTPWYKLRGSQRQQRRREPPTKETGSSGRRPEVPPSAAPPPEPSLLPRGREGTTVSAERGKCEKCKSKHILATDARAKVSRLRQQVEGPCQHARLYDQNRTLAQGISPPFSLPLSLGGGDPRKKIISLKTRARNGENPLSTHLRDDYFLAFSAGRPRHANVPHPVSAAPLTCSGGLSRPRWCLVSRADTRAAASSACAV